jgi:hypothetical protein
MSQIRASRARGGGNPADRVGVGILVLMFLGGLWLMVAPFMVGYQDRTAHWTNGTINIFIVGAGVALLALATIVVFVAGVLFELARRNRALQEEPTPDSQTS